MSKLIPQTLLEEIPNLYATEDVKDPLCYVKLFTPDSQWSWYITEISKDNYDTCFGYVVGLEAELGYFTLSEFETINGPLGLSIERDLSFSPMPLSQVKRGL